MVPAQLLKAGTGSVDLRGESDKTPAASRSVFNAELRNLQFLEDPVLLKRHRNRSRHNWIVELLKHRIQELVDLPFVQDPVCPDVVEMAILLVLQPNVGVRV